MLSEHWAGSKTEGHRRDNVPVLGQDVFVQHYPNMHPSNRLGLRLFPNPASYASIDPELGHAATVGSN